MRRSILLIPLSLLLACSGGKDRESGSSAAGADNSAAGVVIEVTGKVTARLAGTKEYRLLSVDSEVFAKDTITTAKDASIGIRLYHNGAVLSLAGDKSRRLEQTAAWRAPRGASAGLLENTSESNTAAAGRHAEKEAAGTRATALAGDESKPEPAPPPRAPQKPAATPPPAAALPPPPTAAPPPPTAAPPPPPREPSPTPKPLEKKAKRKATKKLVPRRLVEDSKPTPPPDLEQGVTEAAAEPPDKPSRAAVQAGIAAIKDELRACEQSHPVKGVVKVTFTITPSGQVASVQVKSTPDPGLSTCVVAALKKVRFEKSKQGITVTYPLAFR